MQVTLTEVQKTELESLHRKERDKRVCDRYKAILLSSEGWEIKAIAQALRLHSETIRVHLQAWVNEKKVAPENGGSESKLTASEGQQLEAHLQQHCYKCAKDICAYVYNTYGVKYSVAGMTHWLHARGFKYKDRKGIPSKSNIEAQQQAIAHYQQLRDTRQSNEVILFMDATHPTMTTKTSRGWIKKGQAHYVKQTASRTRHNVIGAVDIESKEVHSICPEKVNTETTTQLLEKIRLAYPNAPKIHVFIDQAGYHRSEAFKENALSLGITLHYLPPYSPNLNPIERLWKVMNEQCRNNVFFHSAKEFRQTIDHFFEHTVKEIRETVLTSRITDNFQVLESVSSI